MATTDYLSPYERTLRDEGDDAAREVYESGGLVFPSSTASSDHTSQAGGGAGQVGRQNPTPTAADALAGYTPEQQDFLRRNQNPDGSYDIHRLDSAFQSTGHRTQDSQSGQYDSITHQPIAGTAAAQGAVTPRQSAPPFQNTAPLFDDPASRLIEDYALDRFGQRQNPDPNSGTALFEQYARELMETLNQPVYSPQEEAALKGKAIGSIEQERSSTKQRWVEEVSRRGFAPSSGVALEGLLKIDEHFNQARNVFEREFAISAIGATRDQRFQRLDTAGKLAGSEEARLREAGTYAAIPKQLQDNSFQQGLQLVGAGGSPQSVLNSAVQLAQQAQQSDFYTSQQRQQLTSGLLQYLGYIFG